MIGTFEHNLKEHPADCRSNARIAWRRKYREFNLLEEKEREERPGEGPEPLAQQIGS